MFFKSEHSGIYATSMKELQFVAKCKSASVAEMLATMELLPGRPCTEYFIQRPRQITATYARQLRKQGYTVLRLNKRK